jgi:hypothetical protein
VSDTVGITDVATAVALFLGDVAESIAVAEAQVVALLLTINEAMAVADTIAAQTDYTEAISDTAGVIDVLNSASAYQLARAETMTLTETNGGRNLWENVDDTQDANWQNINTSQTPGWSVLIT